MKKKLVFLLLACLLLCLASTSAMANDEEVFRNIRYRIHEDYVSVCGYQQGLTSASIEGYFQNKPVTTIESSAFKGCTSLKSVTIPDSVDTIGASAFQGCTSLKEVSIPDRVLALERNAFNGCTSLESVKIGNLVFSINSGVFSGCTSLKNVTIPSSVTFIYDEAFKGCSEISFIFRGSTPPTFASAWIDLDAVNLICVPEGSKNAYKNVLPVELADRIVTAASYAIESPDIEVNIRLVMTELPADEHSKLEPEAKKKGAEALGVGLLDLRDLIRVRMADWKLEIRRSIDEAWEEAKIKMIISDYPETYPDGKLPISIPLPAAAVGKDVAVLHYVDGAWKREAATVSGGQLTTYLASLSPVAIVWAEEEVVNVDLPKTGDESSVILWSALACISLFGVIALARKKKKA